MSKVNRLLDIHTFSLQRICVNIYAKSADLITDNAFKCVYERYEAIPEDTFLTPSADSQIASVSSMLSMRAIPSSRLMQNNAVESASAIAEFSVITETE